MVYLIIIAAFALVTLAGVVLSNGGESARRYELEMQLKSHPKGYYN